MEFGGSLHLFYRGDGGEVWHRSSGDGRRWAARGPVGSGLVGSGLVGSGRPKGRPSNGTVTSAAGNGLPNELTGGTGAYGDAPVAVPFGGRLFVLVRGAQDGGRVEVSSTDGEGWEAMRRIGRGESVRASTRPAAVAFRGRLFVFFRGESAAGTVLSVSTANGRSWQGPVNLTEATRGVRAAGAPFPIVFDDRLVVLTRDPASGEVVVVESRDGVNWSTGHALTGSESEECPVAVVHDSRLVVFFQGLGGLVGMASRSAGGAWRVEVLPRAAHWPPVPVVLGGRLTLLARDYLDPRALGAVDCDGRRTALGDVAGAPSVVVRGERATVAFADPVGGVSAAELRAGAVTADGTDH